MTRWMLAVALVVTATSAARAETVAIEGAKVHVAPGKTLESATVVLSDGAITAVGKNARVPKGARRIDGTGKVVTAGFIDGYSRLGLVEVSLESTTVEGQFNADGDDVVHAAYRVTDGYNPSSVAIPVARTGGVTSVVSVPRGGLVAGTSAWVTLADAVDVDDVTVDASAGLHAVLGIPSLGPASGSRGMALERLRELLDDADQYRRNKRGYDRNQSRDLAAERLDLAALEPVLRRRVPMVVHADRSSDILAALDLASERGIDVVIAGGTEAWRVAEDLAAADVPVILDPTSNLPKSFDEVYVRNDAAAILREAGVTVVISTLGDASSTRTLRQLCGVAVSFGLSWDDALAAVTTAPAGAYGITDRGTVARGQVADVVLWTGDPFELSSKAERVFIGGEEQSLTTRQTRLLQRYRTL